jgi:hypothetical protein
MHKLTLTTFAGQEFVQFLSSKKMILEYISKLEEVTPSSIAFYVNSPTVNVYGWTKGKAKVS